MTALMRLVELDSGQIIIDCVDTSKLLGGNVCIQTNTGNSQVIVYSCTAREAIG